MSMLSCCFSVTKSCLTLWLHGLQHVRLPCPSLSLGVCSKSYPLRWRCYLTISCSVALFSFCLQSFPESGSFRVNWLFASGGQSIGASVSASVLPMSIQVWFPCLITLQSKGPSRVFSNTTVQTFSCWLLSISNMNLKFLHKHFLVSLLISF